MSVRYECTTCCFATTSIKSVYKHEEGSTHRCREIEEKEVDDEQ